jgi:hypothetical protein
MQGMIGFGDQLDGRRRLGNHLQRVGDHCGERWMLLDIPDPLESPICENGPKVPPSMWAATLTRYCWPWSRPVML